MTAVIDITRAVAIDGWMSESELIWLAEQAVEHRTIVEIGSYLGRSTRALLDHTLGVVYAIDDWKGPRDIPLSKEDRHRLVFKFMQNVDAAKHMKVNMIEGKLHMIVGEYSSVYNDIGSVNSISPDMVFIDGSHEYEDVKRDICFWKDKIVPGGLLCGHDAGVFDGVTQAVSELLADAEVADNTSIWWVKV